MKKLFLEYMASRFKDVDEPDEQPGPVITISREFGCSAVTLAQNLANRIRVHTGNDEWHWINRRIIEDSAEELKVSPGRIKHVFESKEKSFLSDMILAFSENYYTSDATIRRTMSRVIRSFANKGNIIIVGSAGAIICRNYVASLHVRLFAPLDWRIDMVSDEHHITRAAASSLINDMDLKRTQLSESFLMKKLNMGVFDVAYNRASLREEDILSTLIELSESKNLF